MKVKWQETNPNPFSPSQVSFYFLFTSFTELVYYGSDRFQHCCVSLFCFPFTSQALSCPSVILDEQLYEKFL